MFWRSPRERRIQQATLDQWLLGSRTLEQDARGVKVAQLADGSFLKLFRTRGVFSSARLYSYARRFARNAELLRLKGYRTVAVQEVVCVGWSGVSAVRYLPVPGTSLRDLIRAGAHSESLCQRVGQFIAGLHADGIYFRSLHTGNLIELPDHQLGLIDIADLRFYRTPLSSRLRARNWLHLLRYADEPAANGWSWAEIFLAYGRAASLAPHQLDRVATVHAALPRQR